MDPKQVERFLVPISATSPGGEDLSFDPIMDEIRDARRADDPSLAQGDWVRELKQADWPKVAKLSETLLLERTKDLQVACWYSEALARREGFAGVALGFQILEGLLNGFWEDLYPRLDDGGLDLRIARLEWLDSTLGIALRTLPMTEPTTGGFSLLKWNETREVENQVRGLMDDSAKESVLQKALQEGKLVAEVFDKSVKSSGPKWFRKLHEEVAAAQVAFQSLLATVDQKMGLDAPPLDAIKEAMEGCEALARTLLGRFEAVAPAPSVAPPSKAIAMASQALQAARNLLPSFAPRANPGPEAVEAVEALDPLAARAQAVAQLREVATYFRTYEPHSPVAPLVDRAARWAAMDLETWLTEVVKDDSVLAQLKTLLDFQAPPS